MNLVGEKIYLKPLKVDDVTESYIEWINNEEITQFMECRFTKHSADDIKNYVKGIYSSENDYIFGIYIKENKEYIGNIKIGNINSRHRFGDVGIMIGNKNAWGKGFGSEAIKLISDFAKKDLNLNKLIAGIYDNNAGCYRAFLNAGFTDAARYKKHRYYKGKYVDQIVVEKLFS